MVAPDPVSDSDLKEALVRLQSVKPPVPNKKWDTYEPTTYTSWRLVIDAGVVKIAGQKFEKSEPPDPSDFAEGRASRKAAETSQMYDDAVILDTAQSNAVYDYDLRFGEPDARPPPCNAYREKLLARTRRAWSA